MSVRTMELSGYDDRKALMAQRYNRAGKSMFVVALPLHLIASHLPIPDPDKPFDGNRRVNTNHAKAFGEYWRENEKWATPPLLLDTLAPLAREFKAELEVGGVEFGVVKLPHNSNRELQILDGQHRILGWTYIADTISKELNEARESAQKARNSGDQLMIQVANEKLERIEADQQRLRNEYVTMEILEGITIEEHKQLFNDIAVNARGITKSLTSSFDRRKLVNRVAQELAGSHRLLEGRVDFEKDRVVGRNNPRLLSGKNITDIISAVVLGMHGRMSRRREDSLRETAVFNLVSEFFDLLCESFTEFQEILAGDMHAGELREETLLGTPSVLRPLAGAFHELAVDASDESVPRVDPAGLEKVRWLFEALADEVSLPISKDWLATGLFRDLEAKAPTARQQDLRELTRLFVLWANEGELFTGLEQPEQEEEPPTAQAWA